ncbi:MAG: acyltransferase family protein [Bacteroidales bacterium]|nr:acyltransferase family protein [Bacteroidales bacterium]
MTKRIEYIDALRGFTMILVVFAHVETFGFFHFSYSSFIGQLFQSFRMPLFFFISGYIAYKAGKIWDGKALGEGMLKKLKVQLVPTIFFGMIFTYVITGLTFSVFINQPEKLGYWFTIVLLEMFVIYYLVSYFCHWSKNREALISILLALIAILLFIVKVPFKTIPELNNIGNITSLHYTFSYFQFFVFGNIISRYKEKSEALLDNKYLSALAIILFFGVFAIKFKLFNANDEITIGSGKIISTLLSAICGYFGIIVTFNFFRKYESLFSQERAFGRNLQFVGRRTLDIYMLQYFLLPNIPGIGEFLKSSGNLVIELFLGIGISILIIFVCLVISNILRESKFLAYWLFGAKDKL